MPNHPRIQTPAGYAPGFAVGYADPTDSLILVSETERLPVTSVVAAPPPFVGQSSTSSIVGPFEAVAGRIVTVTLGGTWQGTIKLLRSTDGGSTRVALRVAGEPWAEYRQPGCEQAWLETEDGSSYYLDIQLGSGTADYRVSQ